MGKSQKLVKKNREENQTWNEEDWESIQRCSEEDWEKNQTQMVQIAFLGLIHARLYCLIEPKDSRSPYAVKT